MSNIKQDNTQIEVEATTQSRHAFPSVQLALNGRAIYMHNFKAIIKVVRETQDMSGQASSTKKSEKGVKSKELTISGLIPFRYPEWLKLIFQLAESEDKKGVQTKYRIANSSAETVNMREGIFSGEVSAVEDSLQGWAVSFTLVEKDSIAEKKIQRAKKTTPKAKTKSQSKATSPSVANASTNSTSSIAPITQNNSSKVGDDPKRSEWDKRIERAEKEGISALWR